MGRLEPTSHKTYSISMKRSSLFVMCILNTLLGFAQFGGLQFHQPTLYDVDNSSLIESTRDAIEADNARSRSQLNQLANVRLKVINLLAEDIDQELRDTLNAYYQNLNTYSTTYLYRYQYQEIMEISRNVDNAVVAYNNRVAMQKQQETESKKEWTGTGFALNGKYVVTNFHVVDGATHILLKGIGGDFNKQYEANIVYVDANNDLAILQISDSSFIGFSNLPYSLEQKIMEVGEEIYTLGYPMSSIMGEEIKYTQGVVSSKTGIQGDVTVYQISAPIQPGNSGGPLFNKQGNIVGITSSGLNREMFNSENVNYAIKVSYLMTLIVNLMDIQVIPNGQKNSTCNLTEQITNNKEYIFIISCNQ